MGFEESPVLNAESEKGGIAKELSEARGMLGYLEDQVVEMQRRYDEHMVVAQDEGNPRQREAWLSAQDCIKTRDGWKNKVAIQKAEIERLEMKLRESTS